MMKKLLTRMCIVPFLIMIGCNDDELNIDYDRLQNEKGWYAYEYKRADPGEETDFINREPYIILGEYGSGFKIKEDGVCHIAYSDGSQPIGEGVVTRKWEKNDEGEIVFTSQSSEVINVQIVEIDFDFLWIKYEQAGDNWEYKLRRIN